MSALAAAAACAEHTAMSWPGALAVVGSGAAVAFIVWVMFGER